MSAVGSPPAPDLMRTYMLRSSTPASTEKVLLYLEGMQKAPPLGEDNDAASVRGSELLHSPVPRGSVAGSARHLEALAGDNVDYYGIQGDGPDIRSDIQEGNGSDIARTVPIQITGFPDHEPGPDDPPGIRPGFESYGSSFGNFGPLRDSVPAGGNNWTGQPWQNSPSKIPGTALPDVLPASPTESHPNPFQQFGMTPANPAGIPLPKSVLSGPMSGEPPMSPGGKSRKTGASRVSNNDANGALSPKAPSRALSPTRTGTGAPTERPWSPRSGASRATQKTKGIVYPPLPESVIADVPKSPTQRATSPPPRTHNKSPSISPSESASQYRARPSARPSASANPSHKPSKSLKSIMEVNGESSESHRAGGSRVATSQRDARSQAPMSPRSQASHTVLPQHRTGNTNDELQRAAASAVSATRSKRSNLDPEATPTPSRPTSPAVDLGLNAEEQRLVNDVLMNPRTRTSYAASQAAPSMLEPEVQHSHFHDMELCQLLHALDSPMGEPVKKAVRKAVRTRVKKLGMKYDNESIKQYRKSFHDHDPLVHMMMAPPPMPSSKRSTTLGASADPPEWAKDLIDGMINMRDRLDNLAPKIERSLRSSRGVGSFTDGQSYTNGRHYSNSDMNGPYAHTPLTQTTHILAHQQTGTMGDESMFQNGENEMIRESTHLHTLPGSMHHHDGSMHDAIDEEDMYEDEDPHHLDQTVHDGDTRGPPSEYNDREDSSGRQYLEEELYKLRIKPNAGSQSIAATHKTWELARDNGEEYDGDDAQAAVTESGMPEIPDGATGYTERGGSPPLPPIPADNRDMVSMPEAQPWQPEEYGNEPRVPPWQRIHQRLLSWAIVWPMAELDGALHSTTRGMQVDEIALSIWSTQTYKRYVRAKMTDSPPGRVDRLFVPPNMADAISTAVYNGRHGDACGMLRDLWAPFGLEGMPRLLIVLAKHRTDESHWVVHRFSLPDGTLTTYDTYPERCLPDGRPLGWWFAIRIAWPDTVYPSPDHLMQKMVRLHRPMQLGIDNSVAAAGIWRNLLMGSRAERSLDLERLRDLINTEVKNLRQRKQMGKLSIGSPRPNWEDMH